MNDLNWELIDEMIEEGYINARTHPTLPLTIYNYSKKCQPEQMWNDATINCRGLIVTNDRQQIVARPFKKFFNYGETKHVDTPIVDPSVNTGPLTEEEKEVLRSGGCDLSPYTGPDPSKFEVYEKMDGSLFIVAIYASESTYKTHALGGPVVVATRGSFISEMSVVGNKLFNVGYQYWLTHGTSEESDATQMKPGVTYLFEVCYPAGGGLGGNRVVVDYHGREFLTLLAIVDNATNQEKSYEELQVFARAYNFELVKRYDDLADKTPAELVKLEEENREGFVLKFWNNQRIKVKFAWYARLHKIITCCSDKGVWEHLSAGGTIAEFVSRKDTGEHFYNWLLENALNLYDRRQKIVVSTKRAMSSCPQCGGATRKEQAEYIKANCEHPGVAFLMLDGRDYDDAVWKLLKPQQAAMFKAGAQYNE